LEIIDASKIKIHFQSTNKAGFTEEKEKIL